MTVQVQKLVISCESEDKKERGVKENLSPKHNAPHLPGLIIDALSFLKRIAAL